MDLFISLGLLVIFLAVLFLPFRVWIVERNLEVFLFVCGTAALTLSGFMVIPGQHTGWSTKIVTEAVISPLDITRVFGIPVGIVQIVLFIGLLIHVFHQRLHSAISRMAGILSIRVLVLVLIIVLGLVSSIISAILAAIILVEIVNALPIGRRAKIDLAVVSCFSIGLGAGLTPLGEPLSTIVVAKLAGEPYFAGFDFLVRLLAVYIVPSILVLGLAGLVLMSRREPENGPVKCIVERESIRKVIIRAARVFLFIMALTFLGEGFRPLILKYIINIPAAGLFWINIVSAVLDNATLAAAEILPVLSIQQINGALLALLVSGGMLIPGNIPNIIAASKLEITSREWARVGVPLGLFLMGIFFIVLFVPGFLGFS